MDLGIQGKRALVCASSKGLGLGCAEALAGAGVNLVMNARGTEALEAEAARLRSEHGVDVQTVACDVTSPEGQAEVIKVAQGVDILVTNAGGPPPGVWSDWERDDFIKALDANMLTPIAFMKALLPGMMEKGWGRVVNITSQSVRAPIAVLGLSNAARTGLTGYVAEPRARWHRMGLRSTTCCPVSTRLIARCRWTAAFRPRKGFRWSRHVPSVRLRSRSAVMVHGRNLVQPAPFCVRSMQGSSLGRISCWTVAAPI